MCAAPGRPLPGRTRLARRTRADLQRIADNPAERLESGLGNRHSPHESPVAAPPATPQGAKGMTHPMMHVLFLLCLLAMAVMTFRHMRRPHDIEPPAEMPDEPGRPCRWRRDKSMPSNGVMLRWRCTACNAHGYTIDGQKPQRCKREVDEPVA